jgi:hypothetical protein
MGAACFIVAESDPGDPDLFVNGKNLAREQAKIEAAARELGVKDLMEFFSQNPDDAAEFFDGDPSELPVETWFEAEEGLSRRNSVERVVSRQSGGTFQWLSPGAIPSGYSLVVHL